MVIYNIIFKFFFNPIKLIRMINTAIDTIAIKILRIQEGQKYYYAENRSVAIILHYETILHIFITLLKMFDNRILRSSLVFRLTIYNPHAIDSVMRGQLDFNTHEPSRNKLMVMVESKIPPNTPELTSTKNIENTVFTSFPTSSTGVWCQ